ncbi:quinohemoprotein amine dehydrogenase subunit beta [Neomegalonema perideroedes]|uniref:quinohemoprotein amine dehydrogenase subunit beta n=1 Tax=Neomegalonema perideroedes TaxID=217219 RepID=UPI000365D154|nr:quinohemoprotein amine dehydrogenase subunit beta [Neomegalonema perideroedes]
MKIRPLSALLGVALALPALSWAEARDYIIAPSRPDKLVVVDTEAMAVDKVIRIEDAGPTPMVPVLSPDAKTVYAIVNRSESVVKIDLESGETLARVDFSTPERRVKALFGMDISPDGSTLAIFQTPVKLGTTHYEVEPTSIAFYDAETLELKREAPSPRQITLMMYSADGEKLYAIGRNLHIFDAHTGEMIEERPIQGWENDKRTPPDVLAVWSQYESSGVMSIPFYSFLLDKEPTDPEAGRTGLFTLDRETGESVMRDVEAMDVFYFSTAVNPAKTRAYGAYNVLQSFDLTTGKPIKRVALPRSYYSVNVSSDGKIVWLSGALSDVAAYDAETLERLGHVDLPEGASISLNSVRLFSRPD